MVAENPKTERQLDEVDLRLRWVFGEQQGEYLRKIMDEGLLDQIFGEGVGEVIRQIASGEHPVTKEPQWSPSTAVRTRYFSRSLWNSFDGPL